MEFQQLKRRKRLSNQQKSEILKDHFEKDIPIAILARKNGIHPVTLYSWKRKMSDSNSKKIDIRSIIEENKKLKSELKRAKVAIADLALENETAKEIIDHFKKKELQEQLMNVRPSDLIDI